jgi:hypothetical protein
MRRLWSYMKFGMPHLPCRSREAYSRCRRPKWRFGFGDLITENAKAIGFIAGIIAPAKPL